MRNRHQNYNREDHRQYVYDAVVAHAFDGNRVEVEVERVLARMHDGHDDEWVENVGTERQATQRNKDFCLPEP